MKILCICDSLGLPREGCSYEETWYYLLSKNFAQHDFIGHMVGGKTVPQALDGYNNCFKHYYADIVILQLGIVDCAPRYIIDSKFIPRTMRKMFAKIGLETLYWKIVKLRPRRPDCVFTNLNRFEQAYNRLVLNILNNGSKIIIVKIGHGDERINKSSPYFNTNVDKYNKIIEDIASRNNNVYLVNPLDKVETKWFVDGYHCAAKGMEIVYNSLTDVLHHSIGL